MTPTTTELRAEVLAALAQIAPELEPELQTLPDDAQLREQLDLDSLDVQNLVAALHERLGVDVPERDYAKLDTLGACVAYLATHGAGA
ncbi:MAG TPA: phosphopantetheine-binding protein [Conexibacter sp.]|nr:phosphopantetheine-binding protein [Conexibacter sp.]